jgi:hypothetical protein
MNPFLFAKRYFDRNAVRLRNRVINFALFEQWTVGQALNDEDRFIEELLSVYGIGRKVTDEFMSLLRDAIGPLETAPLSTEDREPVQRPDRTPARRAEIRSLNRISEPIRAAVEAQYQGQRQRHDALPRRVAGPA